MSEAVRRLSDQVARGEGTIRELQRQLERQELVAYLPELREFVDAYVDLWMASDPQRGRTIAGGGPVHPFDRPSPHQPTETRRRQFEWLRGRMEQLTVQARRNLDDPVDYVRSPDQCATCGRQKPGRKPARQAS